MTDAVADITVTSDRGQCGEALQCAAQQPSVTYPRPASAVWRWVKSALSDMAGAGGAEATGDADLLGVYRSWSSRTAAADRGAAPATAVGTVPPSRPSRAIHARPVEHPRPITGKKGQIPVT